jgi:hypothetical protein
VRLYLDHRDERVRVRLGPTIAASACVRVPFPGLWVANYDAGRLPDTTDGGPHPGRQA